MLADHCLVGNKGIYYIKGLCYNPLINAYYSPVSLLNPKPLSLNPEGDVKALFMPAEADNSLPSLA